MRKIISALFMAVTITMLPASGLAASSDQSATSALSFLISKQQPDGSITGGFSNPSLWSAIAFSAYGQDVRNIANNGSSLYDLLVSNTSYTSATDLEAKILAIHSLGGDSTNFGGINYLANLESLYSGGQLGDPSLLNDDMFGLLALIAAGSVSNTEIKQAVLDFIIAHQAPTGAFSYCTDYTAQWCDPSADLTGAALQALQEAKNSGMTSSGLDAAILAARNYLFSNQNPDGGYGYFGSSDADSTAWVMMALNLTDPGSAALANAKSWIISMQQPDGGFPSYSGSDSTTTAHSLIAISGNGWLIANPSSTPSNPGRGGSSNPLASATTAAASAATASMNLSAPITSLFQASNESDASNEAQSVAAKPSSQVAKPASITQTTKPDDFEWRWLLIALSISSLIGASAVYIRYNGVKR